MTWLIVVGGLEVGSENRQRWILLLIIVGQWEEEPMFIDCEAFNRGETGTLANVIEQYCKKGSQICIEGRLQLDQWDDKTTGQKRSKHKIVVETMQLLGSKQDGQGGGVPRTTAPARSMSSGVSSGGGNSGGNDFHDESPPPGNGRTSARRLPPFCAAS